MATQFPETIPVPLVDPVATEINQSIDRLILSLEQRRVHLLTVLRDTREQMRHNHMTSQKMEEELIETRDYLERQIKHNKLHTMQGRMVAQLETKLGELQLNEQPAQEVRFQCDTQELEEHINLLGEIVRLEIPPIPAVPDYAAFHQPIVAVGKQGLSPGKFSGPTDVSIEKESCHIYVVDMNNNRIQIFSQTGEYLNHFGGPYFRCAYGILIHLDSVYVTDTGHHAIFLFKLPGLTMVKRVGTKGPGEKEFHNPRQLAISPNQHLHVADRSNDRIQILSANLDFKKSFQHQTMTQPVDIKFSNNEMFVLSFEDNPCMHVFSLSGKKSRSLVTTGERGMQVQKTYHFVLDNNNNIVISDRSAHNIKVFSPEGNLLHTIGQEGHGAGMFYHPTGIAILNNNKLVCISTNNNFGLQIFSA